MDEEDCEGGLGWQAVGCVPHRGALLHEARNGKGWQQHFWVPGWEQRPLLCCYGEEHYNHGFL